MYIVDGHVLIDITIGDNHTPFPIGTGNLQSLYLIENIDALPQMQMVFKDVQGNLNKSLSLGDGTLICVKIGKYESQNNLVFYNFRVFNPPTLTVSGEGQLYIVNCILDAPKFIRGIVQKAYKGSSSSAISQIAADCGLQFSGIQSNDQQTWLPNNSSYLAMARTIANHGFVDAQSYMRVGLTKKALVKYYNATALITQRPKVALVMGDAEQIPQTVQQQVGASNIFVVFDYKASSDAGLMNYTTGYGAQQSQRQLDGTTTVITNVRATRFSNDFNINRTVYNDVDHVSSTYLPPSAGNTHPNYLQAGYQNKRMKAVFSNVVDVLIEDVSGLEMFDVVYLQLVDRANRETFQAFTGMYFVKAITCAVFGPRYYEKIKLVNTGRNIDPSGENL